MTDARGPCLGRDRRISWQRCESKPAGLGAALTAANSLEFYDACNLILMRFAPSWYPGGGNVFDATTHELVGISVGTDTNAYTCGADHVFGYDAGRFPGPECQVTRRWPGCMSESDGGRNDSCALVGSSI